MLYAKVIGNIAQPLNKLELIPTIDDRQGKCLHGPTPSWQDQLGTAYHTNAQSTLQRCHWTCTTPTSTLKSKTATQTIDQVRPPLRYTLTFLTRTH